MYERSNPDPSATNEIISSLSALINSRSDNLEIMELRRQRKKTYEVIQICQSVLPEHKHKLPDAIDVVHQFGAKRPGSTKPRGIIIQFTSRVLRDATWKAAKTSSYLRDNRLRFTEDLSKEDRERLNKLWPMIDKARKEGKPADFLGGRGFISRVEVFPPS
ncbi:hypothetical protein CRENBAI_012152 [Crenichthys baileyi]|uniref:Uncharacterized protein n=1 Tax=Crenichthys baileyi TaxID=28760 RepID=A0AAV9SL65_9TELE